MDGQFGFNNVAGSTLSVLMTPLLILRLAYVRSRCVEAGGLRSSEAVGEKGRHWEQYKVVTDKDIQDRWSRQPLHLRECPVELVVEQY